jgi:hypothetical protein
MTHLSFGETINIMRASNNEEFASTFQLLMACPDTVCGQRFHRTGEAGYTGGRTFTISSHKGGISK